MEYVEILRGRRVLFWYTVSIVGLLVILALSLLSGHGDVSDAGTIPFEAIALGCVIGAYVVTTAVATGLVSEGMTLPLTWTRPTARTTIAWRFVAVDLATIALAYAIMLVAALAAIAMFGALRFVRIEPGALATIALGYGSAVMWYALILLATARMSGHGVRVATLTWAAFIIIGGVWAAPVPAPIHFVLTVLNYLNPFAYINGVSVGSHGHSTAHPIMLDRNWRIALEWTISAVATFAAVRLWSTREA